MRIDHQRSPERWHFHHELISKPAVTISLLAETIGDVPVHLTQITYSFTQLVWFLTSEVKWWIQLLKSHLTVRFVTRNTYESQQRIHLETLNTSIIWTLGFAFNFFFPFAVFMPQNWPSPFRYVRLSPIRFIMQCQFGYKRICVTTSLNRRRLAFTCKASRDRLELLSLKPATSNEARRIWAIRIVKFHDICPLHSMFGRY